MTDDTDLARLRAEVAELKRQAESVRLQKLQEADCVTPRSIILAAGL